jgi:hypothetical protein
MEATRRSLSPRQLTSSTSGSWTRSSSCERNGRACAALGLSRGRAAWTEPPTPVLALRGHPACLMAGSRAIVRIPRALPAVARPVTAVCRRRRVAERRSGGGQRQRAGKRETRNLTSHAHLLSSAEVRGCPTRRKFTRPTPRDVLEARATGTSAPSCGRVLLLAYTHVKARDCGLSERNIRLRASI